MTLSEVGLNSLLRFRAPSFSCTSGGIRSLDNTCVQRMEAILAKTSEVMPVAAKNVTAHQVKLILAGSGETAFGLTVIHDGRKHVWH